MGKYLFFDIDGTLLSDVTHTVPQSAIEAIKKAKENGHHCFFCTGRSYLMTREISVTGIEDAIIANGAAVVRNGQPELQKVISEDVAEKTLKLIEKLGGGYQIIDWKNGYQNPYTHAMFEEKFKKEFDEPVEDVFKRKSMKTTDEIENNPVLKIDATFDTVEAAEKFMHALDPSLTFIPAGGYTSTFGAKAGEMMLKGVSKGAAIKDFMEAVGEPIENAYAFGDSTNDIEMLEMAGTAIAMGNGADSAKAVADYITDTVDEDGLYNAMKHFELI